MSFYSVDFDGNMSHQNFHSTSIHKECIEVPLGSSKILVVCEVEQIDRGNAVCVRNLSFVDENLNPPREFIDFLRTIVLSMYTKENPILLIQEKNKYA